MARVSFKFLIATLIVAGLLTGCRFALETRDPWHAEEEEKCLAAKAVVASVYMEPMPAVEGPGACGMDHPFKVSAFSQGNVIMEPAGRLACPVIYQTERWIEEVVQPAALAWLGQPIVAIRQMSAYSCRGMNGDPNAKISEHAFGNALDVGAFRTADGQWITVKNGWKGTAEERGFLLQVQAGACERFTTVLAPGSNIYHYDHIHVDLMRHAKGRTICKPAPRPMPAPMPVKAPPPAAPPMAMAPSAPAMMAAPEPEPAPAAAPQPSFLSSLFGPRPAPAAAAEPPPPPPEMPRAAPAVVASPAPPLPAEPVPAAMPARAAPANPQPSRPQAPPPQGLPPGWQVGPQGVPVSSAGGGNIETGSIKRKYYSAPVPQASTLPLPTAKPGED